LIKHITVGAQVGANVWKYFLFQIVAILDTIDCGLFRLPDQDSGLTAGVTSRQVMLTPLGYLIPPLAGVRFHVFPMFYVRLILLFVIIAFHPYILQIGLRKDGVVNNIVLMFS
jgi:hypothetical protein